MLNFGVLEPSLPLIFQLHYSSVQLGGLGPEPRYAGGRGSRPGTPAWTEGRVGEGRGGGRQGGGEAGPAGSARPHPRAGRHSWEAGALTWTRGPRALRGTRPGGFLNPRLSPARTFQSTAPPPEGERHTQTERGRGAEEARPSPRTSQGREESSEPRSYSRRSRPGQRPLARAPPAPTPAPARASMMNNSGYSEAPGFGLGDEVDDACVHGEGPGRGRAVEDQQNTFTLVQRAPQVRGQAPHRPAARPQRRAAPHRAASRGAQPEAHVPQVPPAPQLPPDEAGERVRGPRVPRTRAHQTGVHRSVRAARGRARPKGLAHRDRVLGTGWTPGEPRQGRGWGPAPGGDPDPVLPNPPTPAPRGLCLHPRSGQPASRGGAPGGIQPRPF